MERSRETRKVSMEAQARRRQRGSDFRDSTDEDGPLELQESARPRDRKKERERERERHREWASRNKRRRGDRLTHAGNREDGPEDSTDESVNDDEEGDYDEEGGGGGRLRMLSPNPASTSSQTVSHHHQNHQRRSSVPSTNMFRPTDELIGAPVPRKPRSASTKRALECLVSRPGGISGGDQLHRQASMSPARSSLAAASPSRISPSSSTIFTRKKLKPIGSNKLRYPPEASTSKAPSSSKEDEIEFEIAEVLYGLGRQPPSSSKPEAGANELPNSDSKSRVSSPVPTSSPHQTSILLPHNGSSASLATGPKGKRPRQVNYSSDENFGFRSQASLISKSDVEQAVNSETVPVILEKNLKSGVTNYIASADLEHSIVEQKVEPTKLLRNNWSESNNLRPELTTARLKDDYASSMKRDSSANRFDENREDNHRRRASELGINSHEKFQIDLMAPPPLRSSSDRDTTIEYVPAERNKSVPDSEKLKPMVKDAGKTEITSNKARNLVEIDQKRFKGDLVEESDAQKASLCKERFVELQPNNTESNGGESDLSTAVANRQLILKQQQQGQPHLSGVHTRPQAAGDKTVHIASSLAPAMSIAGWQGGLPPMGYMSPLQGVVSMDGSAVSSARIQPQLVLNQPRPKRCATHCYIARNIFYHQQFTRMNPFWPAAAGSAPTLYGANPCNLNIFPPAELHGSNAVRAMNPVQYRSLSVFPGSNISTDEPSQGPNVVDSTHGKQILLQQSLPAGVPTNLLQGPAFIIPLIQQQAAVAASALTTNMKNPSAAGVAVPTGNPDSVTGSAPSAPATMSFNYPLTANETQYLAVLQNNPYHFAFPTQAGAPQVLRGAHPQAMPLFNGSFYRPPMVYPSQLQQQPQQSAHGHQVPTGHSQNFQGNGSEAGTVHQKQNFASPKNRQSQMPMQQQNQHLTGASSEESPSTADSRGSRYNLPIHVQNLVRTSASSALVGGSTSTVNGKTNGNHLRNGNQSDKKLQQQQKGLKDGADSLPSHQGFAVSFGSPNGGGGPPALDMVTMGQNHAILQNFPDAGRHSYQVTAVATLQTHQNKNFQIVDEVRKRSGIDGSTIDKQRKTAVTRGVLSNDGLSITFSRSDLDISAVQANNVDSSSTNLKVVSGPSRSSGPLLPTSMNTANSLNSKQQHLQKQKLFQLHKQPQQYMASAARGNTTSVSNGNVYPAHLPTNAAMSSKLGNSESAFQQNISGGGSSSPTQCPQWKNSACTSLSQVPAPVLVSSNSASIKNNYQQQSQSSQQKTSTGVQGQPHSTGHQGPSQIMVESPAATSNYKNGGSPKTTTATTVANKVKDSSMPSQTSSSPTIANSVPSSHGNSNIGMNQGNSGRKSQMLQQQQQMKPQLLKLSMQQTQTILPSYMQTGQGPYSTSIPSFLPAANSGNHQRQRPESQSQSPCGSSSVMSVSSAVTSDPAKAFAVATAAGSNVKGPSHRTSNLLVVQHSEQQQLLPSSFVGYMHVAPAGVQAKPAQQKQQID